MLQNLFHSDHFPIAIDMETGRAGADDTEMTPKWKINEADWNKYQATVRSSLENLRKPEEYDAADTNLLIDDFT